MRSLIKSIQFFSLVWLVLFSIASAYADSAVISSEMNGDTMVANCFFDKSDHCHVQLNLDDISTLTGLNNPENFEAINFPGVCSEYTCGGRYNLDSINAAFTMDWSDVGGQYRKVPGIEHFIIEVGDEAGNTGSFNLDVVRYPYNWIDSDNDLVWDQEDNCPFDPNPVPDGSWDQNDSDNDGIGDACDNDPDGDTDNDARLDYEDNCPLVSNKWQLDLDVDDIGDSCDNDIDGDGVLNIYETALGYNPQDVSDGQLAQIALSDHMVRGINNSQALLDKDTDTDEDGISNALEIILGGDPNDANDSGLLNQIKDYVVNSISKSVPAMGGIGLLALGLSMLGLGAVRLRKKS